VFLDDLAADVVFNGFGDGVLVAVAGRAKTGQRGALKTGQCYDAYTSSVPFHASFF
jgi:hypothetical protein